ncbi:MAG: 2-oxo-4-hydroxy-4-carboxy-5-ureidoimidazoline decarboxylase [Verrucomicrobiota bacterium]|nr:2-oxo-4-hydroxy-4-carboxy-5-ureidoimidazoline decarboxylase [Verrucomicrobiota bacterium]
MPNLDELNAMDRETFARTIGSAFEHSPWIAERAWARRPFSALEDLHSSLCATVEAATRDEQLCLIRAHPDLVTRAVLTRESQNEQGSAGLSNLSASEAEQFQNYNAQYRERFGFPFVICARLNQKETILHAFPERLQNSPEREMKTALEEIYKIAELRLHDLLK